MNMSGHDLDLPDGYFIFPLIDTASSSLGLRTSSGWRAEILTGEVVRVALSNRISFAWQSVSDPKEDIARAVERCKCLIEAFQSDSVIRKKGLFRNRLGVQMGEGILWGRYVKSPTWFSSDGPWSQTATTGTRAFTREGFADSGLTITSGLGEFDLADGRHVDLHNSNFVKLSQQSTTSGQRLTLEFKVDDEFPQDWTTSLITLDGVTLFDWLPADATWVPNSMYMEEFSWDGAWDFQLEFDDYSVGLCAQRVRVAAT